MEANKLFLQALEENYNDGFDKYMSSLETKYEANHTFSNKHDKKMQKLIKQQRKPYYKLISTAGRRAACIIVAVIVMSASAMSVKAIREAVFDFIKSIFSDHTVVSTESGTDKGYPEQIEEEYYISELPEGFEATNTIRTNDSIIIEYFMNGDYSSDYVLFSQYTKSSYKANYDNDHNQFDEEIDNEEQKYLIISNEYDTTFIWDNGQYIFEIVSNLPKNEALILCKSTKIKN